LKFSPDGQHLAVQYAGETDLRIWSLVAGGVDCRMPVSGSIDFGPDGNLIAIPNRGPPAPAKSPKKAPFSRNAVLMDPRPADIMKKDPGITILDLRTGIERYRLLAAGGPNQCAFHPSGKKLAVLSSVPHVVAVHDLTPPGTPQIVMAYDRAHDLVWSKEGDRLAIIGSIITVRDPDQPMRFTEIPGPASSISEAMFTPDGLLIGNESGSFRVWDPPTHGVQLSLPGQHVRAGGIATRSDLIAFRGGSEIALWEVTRSPVCRPLGQTYQYQRFEVRDVEWSQDSRFLAGAGPKGTVVYDTQTGREVAWIEEEGDVDTESAGWVAGDSALLTAGTAGIWRRETTRTAEGKLTLGVRRSVAGTSSEPCLQCSVSHNGRLAVVPIGAGNRRLFAIDLETNRGRFLADDFPSLRYSAISPDGRWAAASTWGDAPAQHRVIVWDLSDGKVAKRFTFDEVPASGPLAFSADGKWLVTAAGEEYRLWRVGNWEPGPRKALPPTAIAGPVAYSRVENILAVAWGQNGVRLLAADTLDEVVTLTAPGQSGVTSLAVSSDGNRLAVGCESGVIYIWDLKQLRADLAALDLQWK
jgi:WD40 repeat protein